MTAAGAIPEGYYDLARGKTQQKLLTALESIISSHTQRSYTQLWTDFKDTDTDSNGKIMDLYSDKLWTYGSEQCGNYGNVGDCYNREHSFPKSWFSNATPMYTDLFHLYPTDGKVNGQRSNYAFGECANGTRLSYTVPGTTTTYTGKGRLGASTYSGYTGKVFEPDDEYKGDFARTYFYMVTAYNSQVSTWLTSTNEGDTNLGGTSYPAFNSWSEAMLMEWHRNDPVSAKELRRNEKVDSIQGNRNPFIDHPEMAEYIWGNKKDDAYGWGMVVLANATLIEPEDASMISISGFVGETTTETVTVRGENINYSINVSLVGDCFSIDKTTLTAAEVNAGTTVTISYTPDNEGGHYANLEFLSNEVSAMIQVTGTAVYGNPDYPQEPWLNVSPQELTFTAAVGEAPASQAVEVTSANFSSGDLVYVSLTGDQTMTGEFTLMDASGASFTTLTLDANSTQQFLVSAPAQTTAGTYTGTVYVGVGNYVQQIPITYTVTESSATTGRKFEVVTSVDELVDGRAVIIATDNGFIMGAANGTKRSAVELAPDNDAATSYTINDEEVAIFNLNVGKTGWGFYDAENKNFLSYPGSGNTIGTTTDQFDWVISISSATGTTIKASTADRYIKFNLNSGAEPMFRCYASGLAEVQIYMETQATPVAEPEVTASVQSVNFTSYVYEAPAPQTITINCANYTANDRLYLEITDALNDDDFTFALADGTGGSYTYYSLDPRDEVAVTISAASHPDVGSQYYGVLKATLGNSTIEIPIYHYIEQYIETIDTPTALDPTKLRTTSFVANWTAVDNADHYEINIYEEYEETWEDNNRYDLFTETFANCSGTGGNDNQFSGITGNANASTVTLDNSGWTFYNTGAASGCLSIGSSKTAGWAMTPVVEDATQYGHVEFTAGAWSSDATTIQVTVTSPATDARGELTLLDTPLSIPNGELTTFTLDYDCEESFSGVQVKFAGLTSKNRFFLDNVCVYEGEDVKWTETYVSNEWNATSDTNSYTFTEAQPGNHYRYEVKAVSPSSMESDWSNSIEFDTPTIDPVVGDINGDGAVDGSDVSALLEMVLEGGLSAEQIAVADINGDGGVDGADVSSLLEMVLIGDDEPATTPLYIIGNVGNCEWTISKALPMTVTSTGYEGTFELVTNPSYFTFITSRDYDWLEINANYRLNLGVTGTAEMTPGTPVTFEWPTGTAADDNALYLPIGRYRFVVNSTARTIVAYSVQ